MQIRSATSQDKPAIIDLLKKSLGESTIPKSEALWAWKHEQNPFGPSYVLLAEENNMLIGLRAFMQWDWVWGDQRFKAIRAVDTATHPDFQGKGIFKKLTLQQIDICKKEGVSFVFNTPNSQSKPGYLKMGWVEQGKLPLKFKLVRPLSLVYNKIRAEKKPVILADSDSPIQAWDSNVFNLVNKGAVTSNQLSTHVSNQYITWRYEKNPLFSYNYVTDNSSFIMIFRVKKHSFAKELRIVEFILLNANVEAKKLDKQLKKLSLDFAKENNIDFVSMSGLQYSLYKPYFAWMGMLPVRPLGPSITLKDLNMNEKFPTLLEIKNWSYSLGDLELF